MHPYYYVHYLRTLKQGGKIRHFTHKLCIYALFFHACNRCMVKILTSKVIPLSFRLFKDLSSEISLYVLGYRYEVWLAPSSHILTSYSLEILYTFHLSALLSLLPPAVYSRGVTTTFAFYKLETK